MKRFPIMIGYGEKDYIPYDVIKPHERQALLNQGQALDQLAERGGLSWSEAYAVLMDRDFPFGKEYISKEYYEREVRRIVAEQN